ncbi:Fic family protein [Salinibacterium sp. UTAS2018]|uniref:Fic family protein n=1 Tax=Salinibacterium sp. UTAS2018 TaxID=2508880 RepID=UPI0010095E34|nr:Fic family protein [Salinibacterium sp. UTAS2018]QAV69735.1 Fic family protein [Salinibacterium sp. UTAS2018]
MAFSVDLRWNPQDAAHLSRKDRAPGRYRAYVPGELGEQLPQLGQEAQQAAEDALAVLARADERIGARGGYLNHLLIRSESISSSWIEGNRITPKKLAIAELLQHGTRVALDVVANVRATEEAIASLADRERPVTTADLEQLQHVIEPGLDAGLRTEQNWVGGSGWSPLRADFVPPPESEVRRLVDDLSRFVTATHGNPVVRAAIAHAQFETIHPFIDGNGRTGRALIHTVLRRTDALRNTLIPISTVFAGDVNDYVAGLTAFREDPPRLDDWIIAFANAAELAAANAVRLSDDIAAVDDEIRNALVRYRQAEGVSPATPRRDAVVLRILDALATEPVLTIETVAARHQVSPAAAHRALVQLAEAGILGRNKDHKGKLICWTADRHLALVALTERSNQVGGGDTEHQRPRRGPDAPDPRQTGLLRGNVKDDATPE